MLITINDHVQLDSSTGFHFEQNEMYGDRIYYGENEKDITIISEKIANSTDDDCRPATELPLDTVHRRNECYIGSGWKYFMISASPRAEMMANSDYWQIKEIDFSTKMIGVSLCIETSKDKILLLHKPIAINSPIDINNEIYDDYFSTCNVLMEIGKALVINGQRLTLTISDSKTVAKTILPGFGPPTEEHVSVVPKISV